MLGPLITAEVGDTVHVHFRNALSFPTSIHVHGLWYAKNAEGAPYADGTSGAHKHARAANVSAVAQHSEHVEFWVLA